MQHPQGQGHSNRMDDVPSDAKVFHLAGQLKTLRVGIPAGRDVHDVDANLYILLLWPDLTPAVKKYAFNRAQLLYVALTKGWPAALQLDGAYGDDTLTLPANFQFQPVNRKSAVSTPATQGRGRGLRRGFGARGSSKK